MRSLTWNDVHARRLRVSCLTKTAQRERLVDVVSAACGLQAQALVAAELALGLRVDSLTRRAVESELWERRSIVKTYGPRGTIHLLAAYDLPLWSAAFQAVTPYEELHGAYGLDAEQARAILHTMSSALDGRCLTRMELADVVSAHVGRWARERIASTWTDLLGLGFDAGLLCFGPNRGSQATFARLDQWIGPFNAVRPEHALVVLCGRYLHAYGPATPRDFVQWFAPRRLSVAAATQAMESIAGDLEEVEVDGKRGWLLTSDMEPNNKTEPSSVILLPQYDCYLLGSRFGRESIVPEAARNRINTFKNGRFEGAVGVPVLLIDGVVSGVWERKQRGGSIEVRVQTFVTLTSVQRQSLEVVAEQIAAFFGRPAVLSISPW